MSDEGAFLSPPEAARYLGTEPTLIAVRLGARWRIPLREVSRFGAEHGLIDDGKDRLTDLERRAAELERDVAQLRRSVEAVFGYAVDIANPAKTEAVEQ